MEKKSLHNQKLNYLFEVVIVRTARQLYEFIEIEQDAEILQNLQPLLAALQKTANKYHNETGSLHADLGLELREWATLKQSFLEEASSGSLTPAQIKIDQHFIDQYAQVVDGIIRFLEYTLSINDKPKKHTIDTLRKPPSCWDPEGSSPPYVGVIDGTDHIVSFRTGGLNGDHTLIADGDLSDNPNQFNGADTGPGYDHYGSKY